VLAFAKFAFAFTRLFTFWVLAFAKFAFTFSGLLAFNRIYGKAGIRINFTTYSIFVDWLLLCKSNTESK
jgi:hypothetical protein